MKYYYFVTDKKVKEIAKSISSFGATREEAKKIAKAMSK